MTMKDAMRTLDSTVYGRGFWTGALAGAILISAIWVVNDIRGIFTTINNAKME